MPGLAAYAAACIALASAAWMATGTVAAETPTTTPHLTPAIVLASDPVDPTASPTLAPTDDPTPSPTPDSTAPMATAVVTPALFNYDVYRNGTFVSQMNVHACMAGATLNMLNIIGPKVDLSVARQGVISHELTANTTKDDSHNGGYGPEGWAITLTQEGAGHYKLLIDDSLQAALNDAAYAIRRTGRPAGLLAWWGAHAWVMTGFRSDKDPRKYPSSFHVQGAYIVDTFYPRHSTIWGYTVAPDAYRDMPDMIHNFIPWKRPEGKYPGRDGKWLLVVPY
jgi:hypothetical protein